MRPIKHHSEQFFTTIVGYEALVRESWRGVWLGYVGITAEHPLFGADWHNLDVDVHGGLSFGELGAFDATGMTIHYWLGFDTAHAGDYIPRDRVHWPGARVWTQTDAMLECEKLAAQLKVAENTPASVVHEEEEEPEAGAGSDEYWGEDDDVD